MAAGYSAASGAEESDDPYLWLEEIDGQQCLDWARARNEATFSALGKPDESPLYSQLLEVLESKDKIAHARKYGKFYYNFWQDADHVRGIWRRCSLDEYRKPAEEVDWELVLDVDALCKEEGESWVWKGHTILDEGPDVEPDRTLVKLSPGGTDAFAVREFDLTAKSFVGAVDSGFSVKSCKTRVCWKSRDVLLIGTDLGKQGDMTDSGYPRVSREWQRGASIDDAPIVFEGEQTDVAATASRFYDRGVWHERRSRSVTFYTRAYHWLHKGEWKKVDIPDHIDVDCFKEQFILKLRNAWEVGAKSFDAGSLLAISIDALFDKDWDKMIALFTPSVSESLDEDPYCGTLNYLVVSSMIDVKTKLAYWQYADGVWKLLGEDTSFGMEKIDLTAVEPDASDMLWVVRSGFLQPSSLYLASFTALREGTLGDVPLKALPSFFKADDLEVSQHFATSADGTRVPYFQINKKGLNMDGSNPTILYGYGGFELSMTPVYSALRGRAWYERGGVWIESNIRGGGEYGPGWHQAALKANRNKAYEDFEAIGEDVIKRGVTRREKLGIMGGSNGGLLIGNMLMRGAVDRVGAAVCSVPLLDMKRYSKLLAGASWMGEYGNPETDDWSSFLYKYSPYQLVSNEAKYPPILFTTSTKDDRVHPGHARKMAAKFFEHPSAKDHTYYYENIEGGHGGAADHKQRAFSSALQYNFFWKLLAQ